MELPITERSGSVAKDVDTQGTSGGRKSRKSASKPTKEMLLRMLQQILVEYGDYKTSAMQDGLLIILPKVKIDLHGNIVKLP